MRGIIQKQEMKNVTKQTDTQESAHFLGPMNWRSMAGSRTEPWRKNVM